MNILVQELLFSTVSAWLALIREEVRIYGRKGGGGVNVLESKIILM